MKTTITILLAFAIMSCSNNNNNKEGGINNENYKEENDGKVYLRTMYSAFGGGSLDISWIYLGDDGTLIRNPVHGLNPVNVEAERNGNEKNIGQYELKDDKLHITWNNNKTSEWRIEKKDGEISIIDGGIVTVPNEFNDGETIEGKFSAMALGGGFSRVQTFLFRKDGKFELNASTAISTDYISDYGENSNGGEYELDGNTLRLTFNNGKKQVANIAHWKEDDGSLVLVINNSSFPQE